MNLSEKEALPTEKRNWLTPELELISSDEILSASLIATPETMLILGQTGTAS